MVSALHLNPPFRAEHIGSFLRPAPLFEKRKKFEAKECSLGELKIAEDDAIRNIVKMQQDLGLKTITDGELRRCLPVKYWGVAVLC